MNLNERVAAELGRALVRAIGAEAQLAEAVAAYDARIAELKAELEAATPFPAPDR